MKVSTFTDKKGVFLKEQDNIAYTDKRGQTEGYVRYNGISDVYEFINNDNQSGGPLESITPEIFKEKLTHGKGSIDLWQQ